MAKLVLVLTVICVPALASAQNANPPARQMMLLAPPPHSETSGGVDVSVTLGLENPVWAASQSYYGVSGAKGHGNWIHAGCSDGTGLVYNYQSTGSDFTSGLSAPSFPCSGTIGDNGGTWTFQNVHSFNLTGSPDKVTVSGCPSNCQFVLGGPLTQTINGAGGLVNGDYVYLYGFANADDACMNGGWGQVGSVAAHSLIIGGSTNPFTIAPGQSGMNCTNNNLSGGLADVGTVLVTTSSKIQCVSGKHA